MQEKETWKNIVDFPGYQVSDKGRVISFRRGWRQVLKPTKTFHGYLQVSLCGVSVYRIASVHRLVLTAFIGSCPKGYEANHKEGERNPNAKLKDGEVWLIKKLLFYGVFQKNIAKMFKVSKGCIDHISAEYRWTHVRFIPTDKDRENYRRLLAR